MMSAGRKLRLPQEKKNKKVIAYDADTEEILSEHKTHMLAVKYYGIDRRTVLLHLKGKLNINHSNNENRKIKFRYDERQDT